MKKLFKGNSPTKWAALYLSLIPTFGYVYDCIPRGFYQSSIKLEHAYSDDSKRVAKELCQYIKNNIGHPVQEPILVDSIKLSFEFSPDDLECDDRVSAKSDDIVEFRTRLSFEVLPVGSKYVYDTVSGFSSWIESNIEITYPFQIGDERNTAAPIIESNDNADDLMSLKMNFHSETAFAFVILNDGALNRNSTEPPLVDHVKDAIERIVPTVEGRLNNGFDPNEVSRFLSGDLPLPTNGQHARYEQHPTHARVQLNRFLSASTGFTSDASDNLPRMIYFSATTVTTLGYGDIVPVTGTARFLVMSEAILGVVFIGLFLNSVANRA